MQIGPRLVRAVLGIGFLMSGTGCEPKQTPTVVFSMSDSDTTFILAARRRLPKALGGEEYVSLQRRSHIGLTPEYLIDHNGRFLRNAGIDSGNSGSWARVYIELERPMIGESVALRTNTVGEVSFAFRDYRTGQTSVSNVYRYNVIALVDLDNGLVINRLLSNSLQQERGSRILGLMDSLPRSQTLRGCAVVWAPATRIEP